MPSRIEREDVTTDWPKDIVSVKQLLALQSPASKSLNINQDPPAEESGDAHTKYDFLEVKPLERSRRAEWGRSLGNSRETNSINSSIAAAGAWSEVMFESSPHSSQDDRDYNLLSPDKSYDIAHLVVQGQRHKPTSSFKTGNDLAARKTITGKQPTSGQNRRNSRQSAGVGGGRSGNNRNNDGDDDGDETESESGVEKRSSPEQRSLACPFYKYNGMRYMSCVRLRLTRVRDVKQHLNRRHRRPMLCPVCGVTFVDQQRCDAHIVARQCESPSGGLNIEGITETQSIALARRVNRSLDEAGQWYSIWEILFPGSSRPESPYLSNQLEETLGMVYEYWQRHGQTLLAEVVDMPNHGSINALSQVLDTMLFRFQARSKDAMDPASSNPTTLEYLNFNHTGLSPSTTVIPSYQATLSPPSPQSRSCQQRQSQHQSLQGNSGIDDTCTTADNTESCTAMRLSQSQCTPNRASSHTLSPYPINTMPTNPFDQLEGGVTLTVDNFLAPAQPNLQASTGALSSTDNTYPLEFMHMGNQAQGIGMFSNQESFQPLLLESDVSFWPSDTDGARYHIFEDSNDPKSYQH